MSDLDQNDLTSLTVDGLLEPVRVAVDEWGVAHIVAAGADDVFRAQGYVAARDRLFQLDLWRRRGLGSMAEAYGPEFLERDRAARLFVYRGDMGSEYAAYGPDTERVLRRFVAGINAYIDATERDPRLLPPEFEQLGFRPARWRAEDVCRVRSHGVYANVEQELVRALTVREYGPDVEDLRRLREPYLPVTVPEGLDLSLFDEHVLDDYRLAMGPAVVGAVPPGRAVHVGAGPDGSNNWVLGGGRTESGRPLLANDPHRLVELPSLRYLVHLTCPEFDVIGAGEPALPGVAIGHNATVGFGLTICPTDQEDLYVYELHPDDPECYRYRGDWERMRAVDETFAVSGGDPVTRTLYFTRHGPVVRIDARRKVAFAVRAAWLEPGMAPYLAGLAHLRAADGTEHAEALRRWRCPSVNQVYADTDGSIGWQVCGWVPVRPNWDGLLPVPGDGRYEWAGFRAPDELPGDVDPAAEWLATANQMNLPTDGRVPVEIGYEWFAPYRYQRICEVLAAHDNWTVAACTELQNDYLSMPARRAIALLPDQADDPDAAFGLRLLRDWDLRERHDSVATTVFETWFRDHLRPALYRAALRALPVLADASDSDLAAAYDWVRPFEDYTGDAQVDLRLLGRASDPPLLATLGEAVRRLRADLGPDLEAWRWGRRHRSLLRHPITAMRRDRELPAWAEIGPAPKHGGPETVGNAAHNGSGVQTFGATFRIVLDVGGWDNSVTINSPGQSGNPLSEHYDDLYRRWLDDGYFPLLYSPGSIARHTTRRMLLNPRGE